MTIDDAARFVLPKKLSYLLSAHLIHSGDIDARQNAGEVRLSTTVAPDLCNRTSARENRNPVALKNSQHGSDCTVPLVNRQQSTSVKNGAHAAPLRRAVLSAAAATSSSASLKGPSSSSQRSRAAPSSSFLKRCAAAATNQLDTLVPWRVAASRTAAPISGGIVTDSRSTCAIHTIVSHTSICAEPLRPERRESLESVPRPD